LLPNAATIMEIIRDLLIFVAVMFALCIVLIVVISKMPEDNPLKRILTALSYRVGATLAAGTVAIPIEPIPGVDVLYDIAVPIALIWYWFTFFRDAIRSSDKRRGGPPPSLSQTRISVDGR
jgi:hypothetical protein